MMSMANHLHGHVVMPKDDHVVVQYCQRFTDANIGFLIRQLTILR